MIARGKFAHAGEHRQLAEISGSGDCPGGDVIIVRGNCSNSARASSTVLPLTASVISDAEAFEIAQPEPWNATSLMTSPSSVRYSVSRSPQSGL